MADYQHLSPEEQAKIIEEVRASMPRPEAGQIERERADFKARLLAEAGLGEMPDPLGPDESPDVEIRAAFHQALDAAIAGMPAEVQAAMVALEAAKHAIVTDDG